MKDRWLALLLVLATVGLYAQVVDFEFVYDDDEYVVVNPILDRPSLGADRLAVHDGLDRVDQLDAGVALTLMAEDRDHHITRIGAFNPDIADQAGRGQAVEDVGAARPGIGEAFKRDLCAAAEARVAFQDSRNRRAGGVIGGRDDQAFDREERGEVVEIAAGRLGQHDAARGVVYALAFDDDAIGDNLQDDVDVLAFQGEDRRQMRRARNQVGAQLRKNRFIVQRLHDVRRRQKREIDRGEGAHRIKPSRRIGRPSGRYSPSRSIVTLPWLISEGVASAWTRVRRRRGSHLRKASATAA